MEIAAPAYTSPYEQKLGTKLGTTKQLRRVAQRGYNTPSERIETKMAFSTALTDTKIRTAKPGNKPYKLTDGHGLFLLVRPNGAKLWRAKYRFVGKEKQLSFGAFPDVTLAIAREGHLEARQLLASGVDPMALRKQEKVRQVPETFKPRVREHITIPSELRFTPATGDLVLSLRPNWEEIFAALDAAGFRNFLQDRDQGEYEEREPLDRSK